MSEKPEPQLSSGQAAAAVGVSRSTIKRYAEAGVVQGVRLPSGHWRFSQPEIERFKASLEADLDT